MSRTITISAAAVQHEKNICLTFCKLGVPDQQVNEITYIEVTMTHVRMTHDTCAHADKCMKTSRNSFYYLFIYY